ncbi:kelch domain-containing protein 7A isoform X1 [Monodelphis domestica]|uniref:kelch domain-containing protein 7A isoform X1 n=1 Tax=Monodelphis domestica TaxID=13616 RepID=UPI0024E21251|nr:kelch domain-containing protein 7A isoform X1 [Monodelphis domestica]
MSDSRAEPGAWHLDMQFTGKLVLSATALLLGTLVYKLYKSRPARNPPAGGTAAPDAPAPEEPEVAGQAEPARTSPAAHRRRRRGSREEGAKGAPPPEGAGGAWDRRDLGGTRPGAAPDREEPIPGEFPAWDRVEEKAVGPGKHDLPHLDDGARELENPPPGLGQAHSEAACPGDARPAPGLLLERAGGPREEEELWGAPCPGDMERSWVFSQAAGVSQERRGLLRATSDLGLAVSQRAGEAGTSYVFSSQARAQVEENWLGEQTPGERARGQREASAGPGLRGKIYDYYVESTSRSISSPSGGPGGAVVPQGSPQLPAFGRLPSQPPADFPDADCLTSPGRTHPAGAAEAVSESSSSSGNPFPPPGPGISRKESFLQIAENPEFQLPLDPAGASSSGALPLARRASTRSLDPNAAGAGLEPKVESVAGTNFFQLPLLPGAAQNTRLDLGNCSEVLRLAKREKLDALKEAAYQVMSDNYLQVLQSADIYGHLSGAERELVLRRRLQGQKCLVVADVCPQEGTGRLCAYDQERDAWWPLASLPPEAISWGCSLCSLFNYLFVVAGCPRAGGQASNRMFCYNPLTGIWREMCPLNQARPHCKLVVLDGYMYAIGGECLYTVERYDPRQDRWAFVAALPNDTFALAHTATVCDGEIYVTGGTLRYLLLRYSGQEDRWRASPTGGGKDRTAEMVAVNGFLYRFDLNRSLGIGVYRCSARTRLWYECATYRVPYPAAFQCAVVGNLIHCVGRQFHLRFLADYVSPRFLSGDELQRFPSPQGTLIPTVLALPALNMAQTRV